MNITGINGLSGSSLFTDSLTTKESRNNNATFEDLFQSALGLVKQTNDLTNAAEEAEINYALGYLENEHDLGVAQQKANLSLSYTVQVKNKILEAYKEIMNIQI